MDIKFLKEKLKYKLPRNKTIIIIIKNNNMIKIRIKGRDQDLDLFKTSIIKMKDITRKIIITIEEVLLLQRKIIKEGNKATKNIKLIIKTNNMAITIQNMIMSITLIINKIKKVDREIYIIKGIIVMVEI